MYLPQCTSVCLLVQTACNNLHEPYTLHLICTVYPAVVRFSHGDVVFLNEYQRSYKCQSSSYTLTNKNPNETFVNTTTLHFREWQIQAFDFRKNGTFGNGE